MSATNGPAFGRCSREREVEGISTRCSLAHSRHQEVWELEAVGLGAEHTLRRAACTRPRRYHTVQRSHQRVREGRTAAPGAAAAPRDGGCERAARLSYSAGISACEKGGHWRQALSLLSELSEVSLQPDVIIYSAVASACEKGRQWQQALLLLDEMRQVTLKLDLICYNAGISACEKDGQWQQALFLLGELAQVRLEPHVISTMPPSARARKAGSGSRRCR
ncbi:unnamed protein product [Prorocentrum cordatum]|uniref:Pentatricopeptide repeat-containing protein, chloroplastic n=1 Tax=Prorocentrum cordatum TaxID=2364126 RepID=A0ABN9XTB6_9DINO|nr:unnamed protein product [Polarella glacialis]